MILVLDSKEDKGVTTNTYNHPETNQEVMTIVGKDNKIISMVAYLFGDEDTTFTVNEKQATTSFEAYVFNSEKPGDKAVGKRVEHNYDEKKETPLDGLSMLRHIMKIHPVEPSNTDALEQMAGIVQVLRDERAKLNN